MSLGPFGDYTANNRGNTALPWLETGSDDPDPDVRKLTDWAIKMCA